MSYVTNVILSHHICEKKDEIKEYQLIEKINNWLKEEHGRANELVISEIICEIPTYLMEYNYLHINDFLNYVFSLPWIYLDDIQIFLCEQEDNKYTLYDINNYKERANV